MKEFQAFFQREKKELGIVTGEETDFLATHDAWRGYPRIHVCEERLLGIPSVVSQGIIYHERSNTRRSSFKSLSALASVLVKILLGTLARSIPDMSSVVSKSLTKRNEGIPNLWMTSY